MECGCVEGKALLAASAEAAEGMMDGIGTLCEGLGDGVTREWENPVLIRANDTEEDSVVVGMVCGLTEGTTEDSPLKFHSLCSLEWLSVNLLFVIWRSCSWR